MISDRLRQRLEQLNREVGVCGTNTSTPNAVAPLPSHAALDGEEVMTDWGPHWQLRQTVEALWPASRRYLPQDWPQLPSTTAFTAADRPSDQELSWLSICFPRRTVYLDLETCGFAGSMVFLIGLLHWHQDQWVLTQLWARDYGEEKAILQTLWSILARQDLLVTFNGKSFDWPQVHDRSTLHHLGYRQPPAETWPVRAERTDQPTAVGLTKLTSTDRRPEPWHVDLLHHARRRWKGQLPNCRLQTLERYICGRHRVGDLSGREIPQAYHDYVRRGETRQVRAILHHNALDLVTLLQLALLFVEPSPIRRPG